MSTPATTMVQPHCLAIFMLLFLSFVGLHILILMRDSLIPRLIRARAQVAEGDRCSYSYSFLCLFDYDYEHR